MYPTLFTTTLVFALAALRVQAYFDVNTIELTQCKPATLKWANTDGPYNVIIVPHDNPCGPALVDLGDHDSNEYKWPEVNVAAGSKVLISVLDEKEEEGWSGVITVKPSDDKSCLPSPDHTPSSSPPKPPTPPPTTTKESPSATIVGAANAGLTPGNGASMLRLSSAAVAFTALGALVALL
jgi:hypothetical protein